MKLCWLSCACNVRGTQEIRGSNSCQDRKLVRDCCSTAHPYSHRGCFIHSIFVLFVTICKTNPQLTQPQLGVTRNLKSTSMPLVKMSRDQVVNCPIVDGWKFEDLLRWSTIDGRESQVSRAYSMRPPLSGTHR